MSPTLAHAAIAGAETLAPAPEANGCLQSLVAGAREGDQQSVSGLLAYFREYLTLLGSIHFRQQLLPRVSPSDVVQEAMIRAHQHFDQFRGHSEGELLAWLRKILVNSLAKFVEQHVRAARRNIRRDISLEQVADVNGELASNFASLRSQSPSEAVVVREQSVLLARLLSELPEHYRQVLVLRNIQGLPFEEVAARLQRTPGAVRMLWLRAIEKIRDAYRSAEPS